MEAPAEETQKDNTESVLPDNSITVSLRYPYSTIYL